MSFLYFMLDLLFTRFFKNTNKYVAFPLKNINKSFAYI